MIPLRVSVLVEGRSDPFVVRLGQTREGLHTADDGATAYFEELDGSDAIYKNSEVTIKIRDLDHSHGTGDVLLVEPQQRVAHRLIRANSAHNTLLVTERCDQLCVMCSQPPKSKHVDQFRHLEEAALLAPEDITIGITGGEPLLYKADTLGLIRRVLSARSGISFHLLTNAQHIEADDEFLSGHSLWKRVLWGIPLYSPFAAEHDAIVGKDGAFHKLLRNLNILGRSGAAIELRTVITKQNVCSLPLLATFISRQLPFISVWAVMQLENIGFGRMNWKELFHDSSTDFDFIGRAVDVAAARGLVPRLYNFPLCTVPLAYRPYAVAAISDWKQKYLAGCSGCSRKADCGGFFEWYPETRGFSRVGL